MKRTHTNNNSQRFRNYRIFSGFVYTHFQLTVASESLKLTSETVTNKKIHNM